ncbi:MAG: hypothetical protein Tsb002_10050 [Wenzhouxiangellaceae bacterium]
MSSADILRIILSIAGVLILVGIVLHDHYGRKRRKRNTATGKARREPRVGELELPLPDDDEQASTATPPPPDWGRFEDLDDPPPLHQRDAAAQPYNKLAPPPAQPARRRQPPASAPERATARPAPARPPPAEGGILPQNTDKIITLYVRARSERRISGVELLDAAIKTGLQFGARNIFHRIAEGGEEPIFSMANLVKPGYFDAGAWNMFETPGVALFMTLPGKQPALDTWDAMLAAGQRMAELLSAELLDDARCSMSRQRIGQIREELREYDRRQEIQRGLGHDG